MNAKHTPGPWGINGRDITTPGKYALTIAEIDIGRAEATANARLIAAAPELLGALKSLWIAHIWGKPGDHVCSECEAARRAIAAATGEGER